MHNKYSIQILYKQIERSMRCIFIVLISKREKKIVPMYAKLFGIVLCRLWAFWPQNGALLHNLHEPKLQIYVKINSTTSTV